MCSRYEAPTPAAFRKEYGLARPDVEKPDMCPNYDGVFLRRPPELSSGDEAVAPLEAVTGRWGLVPMGADDKQLKLSTYNAQSERAPTAFTFRFAWRNSQRCVISAAALYEPDWRSDSPTPRSTPIPRASPALMTAL